MSDPKPIGKLLQLQDAVDRAKRAQLSRQESDPAPGVEIEVEIERQRRRENLWRAGPPVTDADLRRLELDQLDDTPSLAAVRAWLRTQTPIIFLSGTVGRGKTLAGCFALARHGGSFLRAADMWRTFMASDEDGSRARVLGSRVLLLDDLGREPNPGKGLGYIETIVDERRNRGRKTVITTNLDAKQLQKRYPDERLWSRVLQDYVWHSDRGPDLRKDDL